MAISPPGARPISAANFGGPDIDSILMISILSISQRSESGEEWVRDAACGSDDWGWRKPVLAARGCEGDLPKAEAAFERGSRRPTGRGLISVAHASREPLLRTDAP